ncbi:hypothetical protein BKA59DRAFT_544509 [Fusarium tricinctum]|uniref:Uncharacterized protein n=1 Tax=Fusarium tricinctum TaxID=61284 RepID=A0A8K0WBL7_9HYPO|nr:hypothetical protein BKA59DRAFT_544509 [Fusarium tricinctum]
MGDQETIGGLTNAVSPYPYDWDPDMAEPLVPEAQNGQIDQTNYAIETLSGYLTIRQNWSILTKRLDDALLRIQYSDRITSTFRSHGFWAWLAIFLASLDDNNDLTVQTLSQFPVSILSDVALFVSQTKVESSLQQYIECILWTDTHAYQRRNQLEYAGLHDYPANPSLNFELYPPNRQHIVLSNTPVPATSIEEHRSSLDVFNAMIQTIDANTSNITSLQERVSPMTRFSMFHIDPVYQWAYPTTDNLALVFEKTLGDLIVRTNSRACITASIPPGTDRCRLVFDVEASVVVRLAMKLYGIEIRERAQRRSVIHPNGSSARIDNSVTLEETDIESWQDLLGDFLLNGVRQSTEYINETRRGIWVSSCLRMKVSASAQDSARISLTMDRRTLVEVRTKLWPVLDPYV